MSTFQLALPSVLKDEGGYSNDPTDSGGATKSGISLRFLRDMFLINNAGMSSILCRRISSADDITITDIQNLTPDKITAIYEIIWNHLNLSSLNYQKIATKLFNLAVNLGDSEAIKIVQRALWSQYDYNSIKDDGILGSVTVGYINHANPDCLLCAIRSEAAGIYRLIIAENPSQKKFENGWFKRAYE